MYPTPKSGVCTWCGCGPWSVLHLPKFTLQACVQQGQEHQAGMARSDAFRGVSNTAQAPREVDMGFVFRRSEHTALRSATGAGVGQALGLFWLLAYTGQHFFPPD